MSQPEADADRGIRRIFESDGLIAVDKPAGLASIPTRDAGAAHVLGILTGETGRRLYVVHRLDSETSGVLVFAKTPVMHRWLSLQFQERLARKEYAALVHGLLPETRGRIDAPLRLFGSGRVGVDRAGGKPCVTEYEVVCRSDSQSFLLVRPLTGRQHQIRAHLYSAGHPVVGDRKYGDRRLQEAYSRLMLHAWRLDLPLPDGTLLSLEAPIPPGFPGIPPSASGGNDSRPDAI
jgi:RluA family pseudouridine synthase